MRALPPCVSRALERGGEGLTLLVIRLAAMGDVVRTLPAVRLLRRALPRCSLHWVVDDRWSGVLAGDRDLDGLVLFPRRGSRLRSVLALARGLRALEADLSLDFHGNLRSGLTAWAAGAAVRVGYAGHQSKELNGWFNTHHVPARSRRTPRLERNLDLVRALGLPAGPLPPTELPMLDAGRARADEIVREAFGGEPYGVLSPGASRTQAYKKPPPAVLAAAVPALSAAGARTLVVWGPGEEDDARRLVALCSSAARLAPSTDLPVLAALLDRARLFVGGDSGPLHLACAVGCPAIGVYGPTDPLVNGPWGVPNRAVFPSGRRYTGIKRIDRRAGFEGLRPEQVASAVADLAAETQL